MRETTANHRIIGNLTRDLAVRGRTAALLPVSVGKSIGAFWEWYHEKKLTGATKLGGRVSEKNAPVDRSIDLEPPADCPR